MYKKIYFGEKSVMQSLDAAKIANDIFIQAAGGIVTNEEGAILIMFRRGKWDLPKGKIDEGETPEQCAVREVAEETGLQAISLLSPITQTYHVYEEKGKQVLKETFWYRMKVEGIQTLSPQTEEDIESLRWIQPAEWVDYAKDSYASVREVMEVYGVK
jgi:mutator protein MutT